MKEYWAKYYKENREILLEKDKLRRPSVEYTKECIVCGNDFKTLHPDYKICSDVCRNKYKKEYSKKYSLKYREINREILRLKQREYRKCNKELEKERHKRWYKNNLEKHREYAKQYRINNREEYIEKHRVRSHIRRTLKLGNGGKYTIDQRKEMLEYFNYRCAYTGECIKDNLHIDHIVPVSKGGTSYIWNLVPSTPFANMSKSNKDMEVWFKEQDYFSQERLDKIYEYIDEMSEKYRELK